MIISELNFDDCTKRFIKYCLKYSHGDIIFIVKPIRLRGVNTPVYALFKTTPPKSINDILEVIVFIQSPDTPQFPSGKFKRVFYTGLQLDQEGYYFFSTNILDNKIKIRLDDMVTYSEFDIHA